LLTHLWSGGFNPVVSPLDATRTTPREAPQRQWDDAARRSLRVGADELLLVPTSPACWDDAAP